jgi:hypothetical protein
MQFEDLDFLADPTVEGAVSDCWADGMGLAYKIHLQVRRTDPPAHNTAVSH